MIQVLKSKSFEPGAQGVSMERWDEEEGLDSFTLPTSLTGPQP
jgi:hypothetical protein